MSAKSSEPMLIMSLKFYRGSCLGYLYGSYTTVWRYVLIKYNTPSPFTINKIKFCDWICKNRSCGLSKYTNLIYHNSWSSKAVACNYTHSWCYYILGMSSDQSVGFHHIHRSRYRLPNQNMCNQKGYKRWSVFSCCLRLSKKLMATSIVVNTSYVIATRFRVTV